MPKKIQNMDPDEIRILLIRAKVSQAEIAREKKVGRQMVYKVIEGLSVSDGIRKHLAQKVKVDIKRIWPDPYLFGGPRKAGRPMTGGEHQTA
jgi:transcriptional regulator with XRE-family HTH domain